MSLMLCWINKPVIRGNLGCTPTYVYLERTNTHMLTPTHIYIHTHSRTFTGTHIQIDAHTEHTHTLNTYT